MGGSATFGQIYIIDQANDIPPNSGVSATIYHGLIGQEFTPTLDSLSFVDLSLSGVPLHTVPGEFTVSIHSGTITSPILGTSSVLSVWQDAGTIGRFLFDTPIALIPGNTYVLSVDVLAGGNWFLGYCALPIVDGPYPGGEMVEIRPIYGQDLFFREGVVVPEPSISGLLALSAGTALLGIRGKRVSL